MMANLFGPPRFIAVEGPLRVGKSTLAQILAETLHARRVVEPENNPFLDRFYQAQAGMGFATQMWFLMERYEQTAAVEHGFRRAGRVRLPLRKRQALRLHQPERCRAEISTTATTSMFREQVPTPDLVIYLQASPEVLKQRLKRKGVPGERAISDAYIEQVVAGL